ncbi:MAG: hypothetical protein ACYDBS_07705 [Acidimicrobiales bacterium]
MTDASEPSGGRLAGEARAAPMEVLLPLADLVIEAVRLRLASNECQLLWQPSTYGRVFSQAALSHECLYVEQIKEALLDDAPSCVLSLMARHHLETWFTGMYLLLGGDRGVQEFLGNTRRSSERQRRHIEQLQAEGRLQDYEFHDLDTDFD